MAQISLTIPDGMLSTAKRKAKAEGYRSVQEYLLQALRDKWFIDNLPRYEQIFKEQKSKGMSLTPEEFSAYSGLIRKGSAKELEAFKNAHVRSK